MDTVDRVQRSSLGALNSQNSTQRVVAPWPARLLKAPTGDPFFQGNISTDTPIVIDFGSCRVRAGFASHNDPVLDMPTVFAKYKLERSNVMDDEDPSLKPYVGNDTLLLPTAAKKVSPFDLNLPYHTDGVEYMFDHIFLRLLSRNGLNEEEEEEDDDEEYDGEDTDDEMDPAPAKRRKLTHGATVGSNAGHRRAPLYDSSIEHPLLLTEAPFIPRMLRSQLMQLAFECYDTPKLALGVDALFSLLYDHNNNYANCYITNSFEGGAPTEPLRGKYYDYKIPEQGLENRMTVDATGKNIIYPDTSLVLSSGFETTHVLPVLGGKLETTKVVRLGVGGHHATDLLNKSILMHHSEHKLAWSRFLASAPAPTPGYPAADAVKEQECFVASPDYLSVLRSIQHVTIGTDFFHYLQIPYDPRPIVTISEEERKAREIRRQEHGERMREAARRKREEKLVEKYYRRQTLEALFTFRATLAPHDLEAEFAKAGLEEDEWPTAATGGPHDIVVQELSEIRKYFERVIDDAVLTERQTPAWKTYTTLEQKLSTLDCKYPLTIIPDDDLSPEELYIKPAHSYFREIAEASVKRSHERDQLKEKREALIKSLAPPASSSSPAPSKPSSARTHQVIELETGEVTPLQKKEEVVQVTLDMDKDLNMLGLEELKAQRKAISTRLQKRVASLHEKKEELKKANEAANKATVADLANIGPAVNLITGPSASTAKPNGVGSIANAIGSRSSRAKRSAVTMFSAAADENLDLDEDGLERRALHRMDNADMASVAATQRLHDLTGLVETRSGLVQSDRDLLAKVDDEILSRLEPDVLRQRERESYQIPLAVNRIRCPEILFQPSIIGVEQQGLIEAAHSVLSRFAHDDCSSSSASSSNPTRRAGSGGISLAQESRNALVQNVYLTGGNTSFRHITSRVYAGLAADLPVGSLIRVIQASSPTLNAWRGAALFANNAHNQEAHFVEQSVYLEEGPERVQERFLNHFASNRTSIQHVNLIE